MLPLSPLEIVNNPQKIDYSIKTVHYLIDKRLLLINFALKFNTMKRILSLLLFTFSLGISNAQIQYVPDSVYFVMEVDLGKVVKSISLERSEERRVGKECRSRWWPYS